MTTYKLPVLAGLIAVVSLSSVAVAAPAGKQVHPPNGASAPVRIAVLADHYTAAQEEEFNQDVENFFKHGLLADNHYFKARAGEFQIKTFFQPVTPGQASNYGFKLAPGTNCAITWVTGGQSSTAKLIDDVVVDFAPRVIVVIGNYPYTFGCSHGNWSYLAVDAVGTDVLPHEFGHVLGGLWDEWAPTPDDSDSYADIVAAPTNCFTRNAMPGGAQARFFGCALHNELAHMHEHCRMGAGHHKKFCPICEGQLRDEFAMLAAASQQVAQPTQGRVFSPSRDFRIMNAAFSLQPDNTSPKPQPILRLLVTFDPENRQITPRSISFTPSAMYLPSYRRTGPYVYEFMNMQSGVFEVGVISSQSFQGRTYNGGAPQHRASGSMPADIVLQFPGIDEQTARKTMPNITLRIYHLPASISDRLITPSTFGKIRSHPSVRLIATVPDILKLM